MTITLQVPTVPAPATSRRQQTGIGVLVALATVAVAFAHRDILSSAFDRLSVADPAWLAIAMLATVACWPAGTACQVGSLPSSPPLGPLFLVQIAGTFSNQLLPGGVGGALVNLRFLNRQGFPIATGLASFALNSASGGIAHVLLLILAALLFPHHFLDVVSTVPVDGRGLLAMGAVAVGAMVAALAWRRGGRRLRLPAALTGLTGGQQTGIRSVAVDPRRAAALWTGSFANPLLHAVALFAVGRSLGMTLGPASVVVISLTVSAVVGLLPAPGGLGAFDVLLPLALVGAGVDLETAVAVTMAYRLVTVWLLLVPSGVLLALLVRRRVL